MAQHPHNPELDKNLACEAFVVDAVRTPIGRYNGGLKDVRPDDLAACAIKALMNRTGMNPGMVCDVAFGCANQAGEDNRNVARMAGLLAGLPITSGGVTINRLCGSGLDAINYAAANIRAGVGGCYIAGGVESMTRAPYVLAKPGEAFERGNREMYDTTLGWRFTNPRLADLYYPYSMGETAENVAEKWHVSRIDQDQFAYESQMKAKAAIEGHCFQDEITPVAIPQKKGEPLQFTTDEYPRFDTTPEKLAKLKPVFRENGTVTAGNASGINDGAAAVLVMSGKEVAELEYRPLARILAWAVAGVDPAYMGIGPIPATRRALKLAGLTIADLDLIELNEAFASQSLVCIRELGLDPAKVNVNGGAIALGHPLGCSGARLLTTLVHALIQRGCRYGLATMCIGVGQGIATIIERV
ncbi:MAG TPA: acetyl-CoA C-acyltransferase [Chloroflexia bacterium]|nr:acetyl-CoA C-acyltransferase [Chloroflexia bacterium]